MKKFISAAVASLLAVAATAAALPISGNAAFDNKYGTGKKILVIGDEISAGQNLKDSEYNYGELLASYCKGSVQNYAEPSMDVDKLNSKLTELSKQKDSDLAAADIVILSVGSTDMTNYASSQLLILADQMGWLKNGYTPATVPTAISLDNIYDIIDADAVQKFLNGGLMNKAALLDAISSIKSDIAITSKDKNSSSYEKLIETKIIPGINNAVKTIKAANKDAVIVVQNVYDPLQLQDSFKSKLSSSKRQAFELLSGEMVDIVKSFNTQLSAVDDVVVADVYSSFTSQNANGNKFGYYFTDMQTSQKATPNQMGHLAIAASIIDKLGNDYKGYNSLPSKVFCSISDKDSFPAAAYDTFMKNIGPQIGDVNMDGSVNASDATAILVDYSYVSTGDNATIPEPVRPFADITNDGKIDSSDATQALVYYTFLSTGGDKQFIDFLLEK